VAIEKSVQSSPLSAFQSAVLIAHDLDPDNAGYNLAYPQRIRGPLDRGRLRQVVEQLHARHETLRTTYHEQGNQPIQRVHEHFEPIFTEIDSSGMGADDLLELAQLEQQRPFDLTQAPSHVTLYCNSPQDHVLLWRFSHICTDFASIDVLIDEFWALYAGEALPAPRATYLDFVAKHEKFRESSAADAMGAQWEKILAGVDSAIDFPLDRPRPRARRGATGASQTFHLDAELTQRLRAIAPNYFRTLLAAWCTLLFRLSGREDLLCGVPASTRGIRFKSVFGNFSNLLPVRVQASRQLPFLEFAERVSDALREASSRRDYPYMDLLQRLRRGGDISRPPMCETDFGFLRMRRTEEGAAMSVRGAPWNAERAGLLLESYPVAQALGQYDVNSWVCEARGETWGELKYVCELFDGETIAQLGCSFVELLRSIAARPNAALGELSLVPEEQRRTAVAINARARRALPATCVHEMFEAQADRTPDAIAVCGEGRALSYRELELCSNRLAHRLIAAGVGTETTVAICLERSPELLIALLAVLKAGGAYVPLDASYPMDRLVHMLSDADPQLLLTQASLISRLPPVTGKTLLLQPDMFEAGCGDRPKTRGELDSVAYLIYTSGSTGRPKGVEVLHRNVANLLGAMRDLPGLTAADTLLSVTTLSFDIAVLELFLPLVVGARLVLASRATVTDAAQLAAMLASEQVTVMQATPATWRMLIDSGWQGDGRLKALCGGEQLTRELANALLARTTELWNLYGPTETTVWSMRCRVQPGDGPVRLGAPIENTSIYVVDSGLLPVPPGVAGELLIGGSGVARGYKNLPAVTAERFVQCALEPDSRLYRTGDLVRQRVDGSVEYLGRSDQQVKIRGFRIELGEVETILRSHPAIADAVAVARGNDTGKRLAAYVVALPGAQVDLAELQAWLRRALPEFMVPQWIVALPAFPMTPNGKIDRKALPAPEPANESAIRYIPPKNQVEVKIAEAFRQTLELERAVGTDEDFFAIGGDSLRAVQLLGALDAEFDRRLPLSVLLTNATVAGVAQAMGTQALETGSLLVPLQTGGSGAPLFCIHPMGGHVFCYSDLALALSGRRPVFGLRARGIEGEADPHENIEAMAAEYVKLIKTVQPRGPIALCGWSMGGMVALEMAMQLRASGFEVALLAAIDTPWPNAVRPVLDRIRRRGAFGLLKVPLERLRRRQHRKRESTRQGPLAMVRRASEFAAMSYAPRSTAEHALFVRSHVGLPTAEPDLAQWKRLVVELDTLVLPGSHFDILKQPVVQKLAEELQQRLAARGC
jgi:amino acid adenylation domain-containing protein